MAFKNSEIWDIARQHYPSFASHTSKSTAELFTAKGYEQLKRQDAKALDEFFELSLRVCLLKVDSSKASDELEVAGFGDHFDVPFGEIIQKIAVYPMKPISVPNTLEDGDSPDPFVVRKAKAAERFFQQNFNYGNLVTIPDDWAMRTIFLAEYGMSEFVNAQMEQLQNGYVIQKYLNKLDAINAYIHSTEHPLQESQELDIKIAGTTATNDELTEMILALNNLKEAMTLGPQTDAYNSMAYPSKQDPSRLKMLIRPGYKNAIQNINALNRPGLELPFDTIVVPNFGGLEHYKEAAFTNKLSPKYDKLGAQVGWVDAEGGDYTGKVYVKDPNADVIAMVADSSLIFEAVQTPYTVEPIRNPRPPRYTDYWAGSMNNTVAVDSLYNAVVVKKVTK